MSSMSIEDIPRFYYFQYAGRPPCWIYCTRVRATQEECSVVFVVVQHWVEIDRVVLSSFVSVIFCEFCLKVPTPLPTNIDNNKLLQYRWRQEASPPPHITFVCGHTRELLAQPIEPITSYFSIGNGSAHVPKSVLSRRGNVDPI